MLNKRCNNNFDFTLHILFPVLIIRETRIYFILIYHNLQEFSLFGAVYVCVRDFEIIIHVYVYWLSFSSQ
jgi:hypothetical protein